MKERVCAKESPECRILPVSPARLRTWQDRDEELAVLAKSLGHPARVQIIRFLLEQGEETCVCGDICEEIPLAQSTVSQHLKMLKEAGLICGEVDGPRVCYSMDKARLERLKALVGGL
jgi:ArsR family transcriptional regulator, arsenate/arsenite/antimonite-responsive transcriptional repressor